MVQLVQRVVRVVLNDAHPPHVAIIEPVLERVTLVNPADLAIVELLALGVDRLAIDNVALLVRSTANHSPDTTWYPEQLLSDLDMSILGAEDDRYDEYALGVQREFRHYPNQWRHPPQVSAAQYARGRIAFLTGLLERTKLFHLFTDLEGPARKNIKREIKQQGKLLRLIEDGTAYE